MLTIHYSQMTMNWRKNFAHRIVYNRTFTIFVVRSRTIFFVICYFTEEQFLDEQSKKMFIVNHSVATNWIVAMYYSLIRHMTLITYASSYWFRVRVFCIVELIFMMEWNVEERLRFVEEVKGKRNLRGPTNPEKKNKNKRNFSWKELSRHVLFRTEKVCRER